MKMCRNKSGRKLTGRELDIAIFGKGSKNEYTYQSYCNYSKELRINKCYI